MLKTKIQEKEQQFNQVVEEIKKREETIAGLKEEIRQLEVQAYQIQGAASAYAEMLEESEKHKIEESAE